MRRNFLRTKVFKDGKIIEDTEVEVEANFKFNYTHFLDNGSGTFKVESYTFSKEIEE